MPGRTAPLARQRFPCAGACSENPCPEACRRGPGRAPITQRDRDGHAVAHGCAEHARAHGSSRPPALSVRGGMLGPGARPRGVASPPRAGRAGGSRRSFSPKRRRGPAHGPCGAPATPPSADGPTGEKGRGARRTASGANPPASGNLRFFSPGGARCAIVALKPIGNVSNPSAPSSSLPARMVWKRFQSAPGTRRRGEGR